MRPRGIDLCQINRDQHNFFAIEFSLRQNLPARASDKTLAPKLESIAAERLFPTDTINRRNVTPIRYRMTTVADFPSGMLISAMRLLL